MFDITDLIPDWKLSVQFWDILDPEITNLPVAIWIDNNQLFPEKRGFWFYISKFKGMTLCSYIDTEGNFYHDLDDFYLSVKELQQLVAFARKYKDIIDELFECEDFFTHDFISLLRYKNPFDPNEVFNIKETRCKGLNHIKEFSALRHKDTNLPMIIWLDEVKAFKNSGHYKRIKFQTNKNQNKTQVSNLCSMDLDGNIYNKESSKDYKLSAKDEKELKNFVKNNRFAIEALADNNINMAFFRDYCITGGEENPALAKVFEEFTKWVIKNPEKKKELFPQYEIMKDVKEKKPE